MAFSPQFLDELRARVGLADVVGRRVRLIKKGREYSGLCPFHKEKTPSFVVNEDKGFYHCFGCGAHGSVFDFVSELEQLSFEDAVRKLAKEVGLSIPSEHLSLKTDHSEKADDSELVLQIEEFQNLLISEATGGIADETRFRILRKALMQNPRVKGVLPSFVRQCRDRGQFWAFIKVRFSTYRERRAYIWSEFNQALEEAEKDYFVPLDEVASLTFHRFDGTHVYDVWKRATQRRSDDPEGAITIARTLIESVCKHILDDVGVAYPKDADLPKLYSLTSEALNLSPSQHTEEVFKRILGGCQTVVNGLATLRNRMSDSHGQGRKQVKPKPHHAELAVNLAGTMASFLICTFEQRLSGNNIPAGTVATRAAHGQGMPR